MRRTRFYLSAVVLTVFLVGQIILSILLYSGGGNSVVENLGWIVLWLSGLFGLLPIYTMRKWGKVPRGKGYMHTTAVVDRGVFSIVRHPQYLAGMLIGIALPLIVQHWAIAVIGAVVVLQLYIDTFEEEKACLEKFGQDYEEYRERVPRANFISGTLRLLVARFRS